MQQTFSWTFLLFFLFVNCSTIKEQPKSSVYANWFKICNQHDSTHNTFCSSFNRPADSMIIISIIIRTMKSSPQLPNPTRIVPLFHRNLSSPLAFKSNKCKLRPTELEHFHGNITWVQIRDTKHWKRNYRFLGLRSHSANSKISAFGAIPEVHHISLPY